MRLYGLIFRPFFNSIPGEVKISVNDITGRTVYMQLLPNPTGEIKEVVDFSDQGPGVYFLQLINDSGVLYRRLVVE